MILYYYKNSSDFMCPLTREQNRKLHVGTIPWRCEWQPTPVFLPGESHGQRSLAWGLSESETTEWLTQTHTQPTKLQLLQIPSSLIQASNKKGEFLYFLSWMVLYYWNSHIYYFQNILNSYPGLPSHYFQLPHLLQWHVKLIHAHPSFFSASYSSQRAF